MTFTYEPRPLSFLGVKPIRDWRVKMYGITEHEGQTPSENLLREAGRIASEVLASGGGYKVAFVTVHEAEAFNQILVDWWELENELRHHVFKALPTSPTDFREITDTGEAFCVWELQILSHERAAWLSNVLKAEPPDFDAYLNDGLSGMV